MTSVIAWPLGRGLQGMLLGACLLMVSVAEGATSVPVVGRLPAMETPTIPIDGRLAAMDTPSIPVDGRLAALDDYPKACAVTTANSFIYGIDNEGVVWETDVNCGTSTAVLSGKSLLGNGSPAFFNGMAYNVSTTTGGIFFWINSNGAIVSWVRASGVYGVVATPTQLQQKAGGDPANGAWYLDSYWFIGTAFPPVSESSTVVQRVMFKPPTTFGGLPTFNGLLSYTINFGEVVRVGFGDIVFAKAGNGILYLAPASADGIAISPTAPMYKVDDVDAMIRAGSAIATRIRVTGVDTKQLSFDQTGTTLWAHDHNTCRWGTVNTNTGAVTDVFKGAACLRDIGGAAAPCACSPASDSYIYGIANDQIIYEVDVNRNTTTAVFNASPYLGNKTSIDNMNSFAYDKQYGGLFFFMDSDGAIMVWERASSVVGQLASTSDVASFGNPANAAYYKSAYWFVVTNKPPVSATSVIISRVAYTPPTSYGALPVLESVTNYTINLQNGNGSPFTIMNGYGDIAFTASESNGSLYLATIPLVTGTLTASLMVVKNVDAAILSGQPWVATPVRNTGLPSLQISFDCADSVLWATSYDTRQWGRLSTTDGTFTYVFTGPGLGTGGFGFRDIGGAACTAVRNCPCLS